MRHVDFAERFERRFPHWVGGRLLVAVSGGADSVALLHLLRHPDLHLTLEVAHVHHQSRGGEADADADFCRRISSDLDLRFHLLRIDPVTSPAEGREAAWRKARYRALLDLRSRRGLGAVATGHHRDDVAEGVLTQLLRGGGTRALAGIAAETPGLVIRPLLEWTRAEIVAWLRDRGIEWREDSSNRDRRHLRNAVRHDLLPQLRTVSPSIESHLVALSRQLAEDDSYFADRLATLDLWIQPWRPDGGVPLAEIRGLPAPLRTRWLHAQAKLSGVGRVSRSQLELFESLVSSGNPRAVTLAGRWRLVLARSQLWLEPPETPPTYSIGLAPGTIAQLPIPGMEVRCAVPEVSAADHIWSWSATDPETLVVRSPAPGDVVPDGAGPVRLSSMLAKHLPRHLRRRWPVFCENDTITWIPGVWQASVCGDLPVEVVTHGRSAGRVYR